MLHTWSFSRLDHSDYITTLSVPLTHFRNQILSQRVVITLPSSIRKKTKKQEKQKKKKKKGQANSQLQKSEKGDRFNY